MIAVVDYDTGNLRSVAEALRRAGAEFRLTADQRLLREAERVISSEEGDTRCMGIFPARVRRLPAAAPDGGRIKVPHVGWDTLSGLRSPLFDGLDEGAYVYYVHSFAAEPCAETVAMTDYGGPFSAALACGNFFGVQFHPEKSGETGARILRNFLNMK